ncbi:hypothetical protein [Clostridium butyricum]|uniref:hypothetical protein n=1 Tax=Clostridium butyricum TaxID=1492 RepID=UPI00232AF880|nr:hypothetical protein [Clostridium butyricum]MDB2162302.1 hypothetical protein [Clostridium butyricum]
MICAYCGENKKPSREHIISSSVLDLFPECFVTIDEIRKNVYLTDPKIKDVCEQCNNERLSYIDTYAKELISNYFLKKYGKEDILEFHYNYTLVQKMLLKYAFNDLRSQKEDISFFSKNVVNFLINKDKVEPLKNITVLAGLAVNTSPAPDYMFGNRKIRWGKNPALLSNSIVENIDYCTGQIKFRNENQIQKFNKMSFSYLFRFNSVQFLLICWENDISDDDLDTNNIILGYQYPYKILNNEGKQTLSRCTSESTYHNEMLIDVTWGQGISDEITFMRNTYSDKNQEYLKIVEELWQEEEENLAKSHPRTKK